MLSLFIILLSNFFLTQEYEPIFQALETMRQQQLHYEHEMNSKERSGNSIQQYATNGGENVNGVSRRRRREDDEIEY
jgi:hypothetical protein